ncbi:MAG: DedA family protein [Saccharopolyspora rectivirgula]
MHALHLAAGPHELSGPAGLAAALMSFLGRVLGGPGLGIANCLDSIFPFLPSEVILPLGGLSVSQGHMSLLGAVLWATLGSMVGGVVMYYLGAWLGHERTRQLAARIPLVKLEEVDRTDAWFAKHGTKAVFFGRMVPLFRGLISIPAGVQRMPLARFVAYTTAGSLIWNTAFIIAGYQLGENWYLVEQYFGVVSTTVGVLVAAAVAYFVVSRVVRRRRERAARRSAADPDDDASTEVIQQVR